MKGKVKGENRRLRRNGETARSTATESTQNAERKETKENGQRESFRRRGLTINNRRGGVKTGFRRRVGRRKSASTFALLIYKGKNVGGRRLAFGGRRRRDVDLERNGKARFGEIDVDK